MKVLDEITPLSDKDCFFIVERYKSVFDFPVHRHPDCELNFIEGGEGICRVVGDSVEEIGPYELTLIGGSDLEHGWEQGNCTSTHVREITIQFSPGLFPPEILSKTQYSAIRQLMDSSGRGLNFPLHAVMMVYPMLDGIFARENSFEQYLTFLKILDTLGKNCSEARVLASSVYAPERGSLAESRRIRAVKQYISQHYAEPVRLDTLAGIAGMTPAAFSRFFSRQTGQCVTDYLIDVRLGTAARMLLDTQLRITDICYSCGFNNISNFNRLFKAKRGYSPRDFREVYKKSNAMI